MHSMTGFGRGEASSDALVASVELSSVNRKQAEVTINISRELTELEIPLRKQILNKISRGRIHAQVTLTSNNPKEGGLTLDLDKAQAIENQFQLLSTHLQRDLLLSPTDFLRVPGILTSEEINTEEAQKIITQATEQALTSLLDMRAREGVDLLSDCKERLESLSNLLNDITERAPVVLASYRSTLLSKLGEADLPTPLDNLLEDERVIKEIALYADRTDISEEITRFQSHIDKFYEYITSGEPVGRSLDFLCQEMNRELNTIGSKASDAPLAHLVVTGKTEVEKIREQVQNVE